MGNQMTMSAETEVLEETLVDETVADQHTIILYNDDVNSFDHVIETLVDVCRHSLLQAEQVAWIVHTKGKCDVKRGGIEKLEPICLELLDRGLSAKIEN